MVKICGVTDAAGIHAAIAAGADAIGLNVVPGTPRELALGRGGRPGAGLPAPRLRRRRQPLIVAITADAMPEGLAAILAAFDPDVVQLNGNESVEASRGIDRRTWKVLHLPAETATGAAAGADSSAPDYVARGRAYLEAGVERLLLDTAGGPHPGGTGTRVGRAPGRGDRP